MAIPPIYVFIAKLLKANRRKKYNKANRGTQEKRRGEAYIAKRTATEIHVKLPDSELVLPKRGPGRPRKIVPGALVHVDNRDPMPIKEQIALCAKHNELESRENTALADAYSLLATIKMQKAVLHGSMDAGDVKEIQDLNKKLSSVNMIIKSLGGTL